MLPAVPKMLPEAWLKEGGPLASDHSPVLTLVWAHLVDRFCVAACEGRCEAAVATVSAL